MSIALQKGGNINLTKECDLKKALIGLGWKSSNNKDTIDLDSSIFLLDKSGKVKSNNDFCYYGRLKICNGAVTHHGDNLIGSSGSGDDEQISIDLEQIPEEIESIIIVVNIYKAEEKKQNFGMVSNAFVRLVNGENNKEVLRFNLPETFSNETAVTFGEIYRKNGGWSFRAVGQGKIDTLYGIATTYGVV